MTGNRFCPPDDIFESVIKKIEEELPKCNGETWRNVKVFSGLTDALSRCHTSWANSIVEAISNGFMLPPQTLQEKIAFSLFVIRDIPINGNEGPLLIMNAFTSSKDGNGTFKLKMLYRWREPFNTTLHSGIMNHNHRVFMEGMDLYYDSNCNVINKEHYIEYDHNFNCSIKGLNLNDPHYTLELNNESKLMEQLSTLVTELIDKKIVLDKQTLEKQNKLREQNYLNANRSYSWD